MAARVKISNARVDKGPWKIGGFPPPPPSIDPSRETMIATERMFWIADGRMAYRAGVEVPLDELGLLRGDAEHAMILRGEKPKRRAKK
jgi:hypothetical protein